MKHLFVVLFVLLIYPAHSQTSTWTVLTLKEYTDQRFDAMQMAVLKAEQATEKRFEGVNEFRTTLSDQQRTFLPRQEYEAGHISLINQIREIKEKQDKIESMKQGGNVIWVYVVSGISLLIAFISAYKRINDKK
jgi:hypothetical protein